MITFKEYLEEGLSKTAQELLSKERTKHRDGSHYVTYDGHRQEKAAQELVKKGHAERITKHDGRYGGEYYNTSFGHGISKKKYSPIGNLHFKDSK